jgi:hypothetical protein
MAFLRRIGGSHPRAPIFGRPFTGVGLERINILVINTSQQIMAAEGLAGRMADGEWGKASE